MQRTSDGALAARDRSGDHDDHVPVRPVRFCTLALAPHIGAPVRQKSCRAITKPVRTLRDVTRKPCVARDRRPGLPFRPGEHMDVHPPGGVLGHRNRPFGESVRPARSVHPESSRTSVQLPPLGPSIERLTGCPHRSVDVAKRWHQRTGKRGEHGPKEALVVEERRADRLADLLLMVPALRELPREVEPVWCGLWSRPVDRRSESEGVDGFRTAAASPARRIPAVTE